MIGNHMLSTRLKCFSVPLVSRFSVLQRQSDQRQLLRIPILQDYDTMKFYSLLRFSMQTFFIT
jgi:hypothetical protein